jgi:hypothetical protein
VAAHLTPLGEGTGMGPFTFFLLPFTFLYRTFAPGLAFIDLKEVLHGQKDEIFALYPAADVFFPVG